MRYQYLPLLVRTDCGKVVLSFRRSSDMHSQSLNGGVIGVTEVTCMLGPVVSVNHIMTMDRLGIIWFIDQLNRIMRHQHYHCWSQVIEARVC